MNTLKPLLHQAARASLLLLLASVLLACSRAEPQPEPVRQVRTLVVGTSSAASTVEYAGEVRARTEARLSFRVPGKLQARLVEVGQAVKPGQALARIDPADLGLSQQAAQAAVRTAQVNHELAQADFKRFKDLRDQGFISGAELDRREAALKSSAAQLEQARAQAAVQTNQATYSTLAADAAGVVVGVDAEPGAVLAAGSPVVRVALDGPRDVVFVVPEDALPAMRSLLGRQAALRVRLWAGGDELRATVRELAAMADPVTRTFAIKADLGTSRTAQLGQTATVLLDRPTAEATLKLPLAVVREHQGKSAVWVFDPAAGAVRSRPVSLAAAQGNEVLVASGLKAGERVVTAGVHVLSEGQVVRLLVDPAASSPR